MENKNLEIEEIENKSEKALEKVKLASNCAAIVIVFILIPFLIFFAPSNEGTSERGFEWANFLYFVLSFIAMFGYIFFIEENIWKIEEKRKIYYPLSNFLIYALIMLFLMSISPALIILCYITLPIAIIVTIKFFIKGRKKDKKSKTVWVEEEEEPKKKRTRKSKK